MDGTRRARLIALSATLALGIALVTAALLATGPRSGDEGRSGEAVVRTPMTVVTGTPVTEMASVVPRTTPPPTAVDAGTRGVDPLTPSAATTVEHP